MKLIRRSVGVEQGVVGTDSSLAELKHRSPSPSKSNKGGSAAVPVYRRLKRWCGDTVADRKINSIIYSID